METAKKTVWIAHRGAHLTHPENSLKAFLEAKDLGFDCIETDLRTTNDGTVVLHHDPDLLRSFGVRGVVEQMTYKRLATFYMKDGQRLMTLEELLTALPSHSFIFDIKKESGARTIETLDKQNIVKSLEGRLRLLFWDKSHARAAKKAWPKQEILANQTECYIAALRCLSHLPGPFAKAGKTYSLPPTFMGTNLFRQKLVARYHAHKGRLIAYLPQGKQEIHAALAAGFDEILSDGWIVTSDS